MRFTVAGAVTLFLLAGCSSGSPTVETGPRPSADVITSSQGERDVEVKTSTAATLGIPPGHLPPPGQCRIWIQGKPPGHQSKAGRCSALQRRVPKGGWLVYRPSESKKQVRVTVYDDVSPVVSVVRFFDVATGRLLREERPGEP